MTKDKELRRSFGYITSNTYNKAPIQLSAWASKRQEKKVLIRNDTTSKSLIPLTLALKT